MAKDLVRAAGDARDIQHVARPLIAARRHELMVTAPVQTLEPVVDPLRPSQIVMNLLTNAAKYTDCGGSIAVSVSAICYGTHGDPVCEGFRHRTRTGEGPHRAARRFS